MKQMKFFVDSCDPEETQKAVTLLGRVDGQTTNPTLLVKNPEIQKYILSGKRLTQPELLRTYQEAIIAIAELTDGPISVEVYADRNTTSDEMIHQANQMKDWTTNVYVKFPTIPEGLKAARAFTQQGGRANMTLVFDQMQAASVYSATRDTRGTSFVSPFVGRWDDRGYYGLDLIRNIRRMYDSFDAVREKNTCHVEILAASIRSLEHIYGAMVFGADIITAPLTAFQEWVDAGSITNPAQPKKPGDLAEIPYQDLTYSDDFASYTIDTETNGLLNKGLEKFAQDWNAVIETA